jgi:leader peptidase (prepilin peptidase)/N-methyltransferase
MAGSIAGLSKETLLSGSLIATAAGTAAIASIFAVPGAPGWLGAMLGLLMVATAAIDARHFFIPDSLNAVGAALGLLHAVSQGQGDAANALILAAARAAALALMFFVLRAVYLRLRGREGMGLGDVKLAAVAGAWLDWTTMPVAIEIAAVTALIAYGARRLILDRPMRATTRLPFGLFFAPAIWLSWILQATVLQPPML